VKRLTILPTEPASEREKRIPAAATTLEPLERRQKPRVERRNAQRRRSIARRVVADRRMALGVHADNALFVDSRSGAERRASSARRFGERRAGVRKIDLRELDLSALGI
jgi:hypothetical protein